MFLFLGGGDDEFAVDVLVDVIDDEHVEEHRDA